MNYGVQVNEDLSDHVTYTQLNTVRGRVQP